MVRTVGDVSSYPLESVAADTTLLSAIETMFEHNFSQLGIERDGEVVGMISYRSISRVLTIMSDLGVEKDLPGRSVEHAIEDVEPLVRPGDDLVDLFDLLAEDPYVIVDHPDRDELRILTNYDLLQYLHETVEPFLLIEDIERSLRALITQVYPSDLDEALTDFFADQKIRTPDSITDCSFSHYAQFMSRHWEPFDPHFNENGDFVRRLITEVGRIRNRLFHFRTETENPEYDEALVRFAHSYFGKRATRPNAETDR